MIDPKLDKLTDETDESAQPSLNDEPRERGARSPRPGLSVRDTVAGDTMLSVGGRGVDTSGVRSGAGAGAGMTNVTPGTSGGGSPAPNVTPSAAGTGTTPLGSAGTDQLPTTRLDTTSPRHDEIAVRAYSCWHERGCPEGSPEIDWHRAERELQEECQRRSATASVASAGGR